MALQIRATVSELLKDLGFATSETSDQISGHREVLGGRLTCAVRFETRKSIAQLPEPSIYAKRFLKSMPNGADEGTKWVVVSKDATDAGERYRDLGRALSAHGIKIGTLEEFLDSFVPRSAISQYLARKTDTTLHNVGYVPQHLGVDGNGRVRALDAVEQWMTDSESPPIGLIHGPAGQGKTIFVERLAKELIHRATSNPSIPVPLLVRFADHRDANSVNALLMHALADVQRGDVTVAALKTLIRAGRIILIFDGLDELSEEVGDRLDSQNIRSLADLIRRDSDGKVLVTARSTFLDTGRAVRDLLSGDHQLWQLLPFDESDQRRFLEHNPPDGVRGAAIARHRDRVMSFVSQSEEIQALATSPFLLKQISIAVSMNQTRLPTNLGDAYETFLTSLCERELVRQRHGLPAARQLRFLERLAHEMVYEQEYAYSKDLFELIIREEFATEIEQADDQEAYGRELVLKLTNHAAFAPVDGDSGDAPDIQFVHESVRDFGSARFLARLLGEADAYMSLKRSAISQRTLPEGVVAFTRDLLSGRDLAALAQLVHRTPTVIDNENLFRIAALSAVEGAFRLAFASRRCENLNLANVVVDGAALTGFVFAGCDLSQALFVSSDLASCDFRTSRVNGAVFRDCVLRRAQFPTGHEVARVDDAIGGVGGDLVSEALLCRGAAVGGIERATGRSSSREGSADELVTHVLNKFYAGARPESARRRTRYADVLERGRSGEERVLIRSTLIPELTKVGVLESSQKGTRESMMVLSSANAEVINYLFRGVMSSRIREVIDVVNSRLN